MIDSDNAITLNGVKYRIAESIEGEHFELGGEPLRPPNAVMVQGTGRQDQFQARPDILLWSISDWSGGEGQVVVEAEAANKHAILECVDPFVRPGTLTPGYDTQYTKDNGGTDPLSGEFVLVKVGAVLVAVDTSQDPVEFYTWDSTNEKWSTANTWTDYTDGAPAIGQICADDTYIYLGKDNDSIMYKLTLTGATLWDVTLAVSDASNLNTSSLNITGISWSPDGTHLYLSDSDGVTVVEYDLSTAWDLSTAVDAGTPLDVSGETSSTRGHGWGDSGNKLYLASGSDKKIFQYTVVSAYNLFTGSYSTKSADISAHSHYVEGVRLSSDGTKMYVLSSLTAGSVYKAEVLQYTLSTAWDVSTAAYASKSVDCSGQISIPRGLDISSDGLTLVVLSDTNAYSYTLATAWDLSSASYHNNKDFSETGTHLEGIAFGNSGALVYIADRINTKTYQFSFVSVWVSSGQWSGANQFCAELGDYVYIMDPDAGKLYEVGKDDTPPVDPTVLWEGDHWLGNGTYGSNFRMMVKGPNKLYAMLVSNTNETIILEVTPTSAAGTGYATEIIRLSGFLGTALWYHNGVIYFAGEKSPNDLNERLLMYLVPDSDPLTYGAVGRVRQPLEDNYDGQIRGSAQGDFLLSPFTVGKSTTRAQLFMLDTVGGGYACFSRAPTADDLRRVVPFEGDQFVEMGDGVLRMFKDQYTITSVTPSYATTPWHNMGLADEKILSSVVLSCEALPADWSVIVSYAKDGSSSFTTIGTLSTAGSTGTRYPVSTGTTTVKFRTLRIKIAFSYAGAGAPTTRPVVFGVDVRAQVSKIQKVWNLALDLSDDRSAGSQSFVGSRKVTNLIAVGDTGSAVTFEEGYSNRIAGVSTSYNVLVDSYKLILTRPGEGYALVVLREVA